MPGVSETSFKHGPDEKVAKSRCGVLGFHAEWCQVRFMRSLQSLLTAGTALLVVTIAHAAPPFGATPPPSLLGTPAPTSPEVTALIAEGQAAYQKGDIDKAKTAFEMA